MPKALIVDDVDYIRNSLEKILEAEGYVCDLCADGAEAISAVETSHYDVIITDILMPNADGFDFIDHLKNIKKSSTPILAMSGGSNTVNPEAVLKHAEEEADAIIFKPFSKEDIINKINEIKNKGDDS